MGLGVMVFAKHGDVSQAGFALPFSNWFQVMDVQEVHGCDFTARVTAMRPQRLQGSVTQGGMPFTGHMGAHSWRALVKTLPIHPKSRRYGFSKFVTTAARVKQQESAAGIRRAQTSVQALSYTPDSHHP
jgi:hypothetical protein